MGKYPKMKQGWLFVTELDGWLDDGHWQWVDDGKDKVTILLSRSIWREHSNHFRATGETSLRLRKIMDYVQKVYSDDAMEAERPD